MSEQPLQEPPKNPITRFITDDENCWTLEQYQSHGGYDGLKKALLMTSPEVLEQIKQSNLRGRGGAGFPTGLKWSFVPQGDDSPSPKYMIVNADEMEPGAFKDRWLLEKSPHQILEGLIVGGYTLKANIGYVFIRGDYYLAIERIEIAIQACYDNGLLGKNILGSGFDYDIHIHTSAGRYICGEETALINSLEGKRANPRAKPPFPQV
ncbi:MAG: NADH-quinone oxidoreductase subunit F, partial [Psychrosphaera sp.]|nr:NADH-quinone oxidoreductase subunit F [Psychrosphaera sp.]